MYTVSLTRKAQRYIREIKTFLFDGTDLKKIKKKNQTEN